MEIDCSRSAGRVSGVGAGDGICTRVRVGDRGAFLSSTGGTQVGRALIRVGGRDRWDRLATADASNSSPTRRIRSGWRTFRFLTVVRSDMRGGWNRYWLNLER